MKYFLSILYLATILFFCTSHSTYAMDLPCGSIIAPEDEFDFESPNISKPVIDCGDPFSITTGLTSPYTVFIDGQVVEQEEVVEIGVEGVNIFAVEGIPLLGGVNHILFLHDGNDYRAVDTRLIEPVEADYRELALEFFPDGTDVEPYIEAIVSGEYYLEDEDMDDLLFDFLDYFEANFIYKIPTLQAGTYTLVSKEYEVILSHNIFEKIYSYFIPTAYAFQENIFTLTFTLKEETQGVSSVLFLPGIKGSRLYSDNGNKVWEPLGNHDVEQLAMTETGQSINNLYTSDIVSKAHNVVDIYDGFARFMTRLTDKDQDNLMEDWTPFAYDWRYGVDDIADNGTQYENEIRDLVDEVNYLAEGSRTGRVTIIAHSNGGLLAKMLVKRLEEEDQSNLIDKVVLLASPQLGTPLAIGSILHGYDEEILGGLIVSDGSAREAIKNMPGGYGLLPSQEYFEKGPGSKVLFDNSESTANFRAAYGTSIDTRSELNAFMSGVDDERPDAIAVEEAIRANDVLLEASSILHDNDLDTWVAPQGVEVIEIVGTGLDTISGFRYAEFSERVCTLGVFNCEIKKFYKPTPLISPYGDKVVIGSSAEGYRGEKQTFYIDLEASDSYGAPYDVDHGEFTNSPAIQELIKDILTETSSEIEFVSQTAPDNSKKRILLGAHSPVALVVIDGEGKQLKVEIDDETGIPFVNNEISGSNYFELGGSKYLILPSEGEYEIEIEGTGEGGLVFTVDSLKGEKQTPLHEVSVATITPSTTIDLTYSNESFSNLSVDIDGDGEEDQEISPDGEIVTDEVTYTDLYEAIDSLSLKKSIKKPAIILVVVSEKFHLHPSKHSLQLERLALEQLEHLLQLYVKMKLIKRKELKPATHIINELQSYE